MPKLLILAIAVPAAMNGAGAGACAAAPSTMSAIVIAALLCATHVQDETLKTAWRLYFWLQYLNLLGERGGTRTLDPMIKSHVLYRLSYALTHLNSGSRRQRVNPHLGIVLQPALCRGQGPSGQ